MHMLNADALTGQGLIVSLILTCQLVASGFLERQLTTALHFWLKLTMELNQRAIKGDPGSQRLIEQESQKWVNFLFDLTHDKTTSLLLFHLFQGAILDFLTTGNAQRGQQTIKAFTADLP